MSHDILLQKLNHHGIRGKVNDLFRSYLAERKQCVSISSYNSRVKTAQFGVPQGSNMGPILFSIYVNDVFHNFKSEPVLYADGTCLAVHAHTAEELTSSVNQEVEVACQWVQYRSIYAI